MVRAAAIAPEPIASTGPAGSQGSSPLAPPQVRAPGKTSSSNRLFQRREAHSCHAKLLGPPARPGARAWWRCGARHARLPRAWSPRPSSEDLDAITGSTRQPPSRHHYTLDCDEPLIGLPTPPDVIGFGYTRAADLHAMGRRRVSRLVGAHYPPVRWLPHKQRRVRRLTGALAF